MSDTTKIAWVRNSDGTPGATFNPWIGCIRVSAGCAGCYAEKFVRRMDAKVRVEWGKGKPRRRTANDNWKKPRRWNREAEAKGIRIRVFTASLADVFDAEVPAEWRADLWQLIRETPNLDWIIVTHRPENIRDMLPEDWGDGWPNVWLVVTVENQKAADHRIPILLTIPAKVRGLSLEPLLGSVDLVPWLQGLDWVLIGGESGSAEAARPMDIQWVGNLLDACDEAGVPAFVKQLGRNPVTLGLATPNPANDDVGADPAYWPKWLRVQQMPRVA
ncbi:MAG TPA: DUF5131 family protein [Azospirillum sp.]|nr:DUF5131 family protein [Azospirillum sp.]